MNTLNPELHVVVLTRNPADPRVESPASEQPRRDIVRLQDRDDLADNTQLPFGLLVLAGRAARLPELEAGAAYVLDCR